MAKVVQVTFDSADPHGLARWWANLLGYTVEENHDFVVELLESGVIGRAEVVTINERLHFADAVAAHDPAGGGPRLYFQRVPEPKPASKNRLHLDVPVGQEDLDAEVERVKKEGGSFSHFDSHPGHRWAVMRDPEGNEFCLH